MNNFSRMIITLYLLFCCFSQNVYALILAEIGFRDTFECVVDFAEPATLSNVKLDYMFESNQIAKTFVLTKKYSSNLILATRSNRRPNEIRSAEDSPSPNKVYAVRDDNGRVIRWEKAYLEEAKNAIRGQFGFNPDGTDDSQPIGGDNPTYIAAYSVTEAGNILAKNRLNHESFMMRKAHLFDAAPGVIDTNDRKLMLKMEPGGVTMQSIMEMMDNNPPSNGELSDATVYLRVSGLTALSKLKEAGIVHTDPHTGNVVLDQNLNPRLIDFDQAKNIGDTELDQFNYLLNESVGGDSRFTSQNFFRDEWPPAPGKVYTNPSTDAEYFEKALQKDLDTMRQDTQSFTHYPGDADDILKTIKRDNNYSASYDRGREYVQNLIRQTGNI